MRGNSEKEREKDKEGREAGSSGGKEKYGTNRLGPSREELKE